jgi:hypothetical protein
MNSYSGLEQQLSSLQAQLSALAPSFSGPQVDRPSVTTVNSGILYFPTDGYYPAKSTGSVWVPQPQMGAGINVINPPASGTLSYARLAGPSSTLVPEGDGQLLTMMGTASSTQNTETYLTPVLAAPYTFTVGIDYLQLWPINYTGIGIVLADGILNTSETVLYYLTGIGTAITNLNIQKFTNYAWTANYYAGVFHTTIPGRIFLRFRDNNTTRFSEMSMDGRNWYLIHSIGRTDFITPTYCGLVIYQNTTAVATNITRAQAKIFHWSLAAGA